MQIIKCQNLVGELLRSIFFTFLAHHDIFPTIIIMPRPNNEGGGVRIRVTDDSAVTLGAEGEVRAELVSAVNATKTKESSVETRRKHRCRMKKLIEWWMIEYPDYFEVGTRALSAKEKADPMKYYHTCDNVDEGLCVDMVIAYMAVTKTRATEEGAVAKIYSCEHMQKIHDAVLLGARTVKKVLSSSHYSEMYSFLQSFKKETAGARCHGNVDKKSADPISFSSSL